MSIKMSHLKLVNLCYQSSSWCVAFFKTVHFKAIQGSRRSASEKPKMFDFDPDILLADEYDEKEETPEHVAEVNDSEEYWDWVEGVAGSTIVVVEQEMEALYGPEDTKYQEQFEVENLENTSLIIF